MGRKEISLVVSAIGVLLFLFGFAGNIQAQCISDDDCVDDGLFCTRERCVNGECGVISTCPAAIVGCVIKGGSSRRGSG